MTNKAPINKRPIKPRTKLPAKFKKNNNKTTLRL